MLHPILRAAARLLPCAALALALLSAQAIAAPRIVVVTSAPPYPYAYQLDDYALDGSVLVRRTLPNSFGGEARDVVQLWGDALGLFQGTFDARIRVLEAGSWSHLAVPGLSVANNTSFGGLAYGHGKLFVGDMFTYGGGEAQGVVRIDLETGLQERWLGERSYEDLAMGLDGRLYGLRDMYGAVDVIDPVGMAIVGTRQLGHTSSSRAIAVDADGTLFMASWDRYIARFDAQGVERARLSLDGPLMDLDLDRDGHLVASDANARIYVTDVHLQRAHAFDAAVGTYTGAFVAFARPTPTDLVAQGSGQGVALAWRDGEALVDVYRNGQRVHRGANSGVFRDALAGPSLRRGLRYRVCNAGTDECSRPRALPAATFGPARSILPTRLRQP